MEHHVHFIAELLAVTVGVQIYFRSKIDDTMDKQTRLLIMVGALIGALLGSRLLAALENPELFFNPPTVLYYYANKTIIGGIAGGILGVELVKRVLNIKAWTGDRVLVPLAVAIIIGRIGCFVLGVEDGTVGGVCDYFWCLEQGDGLLRHPNSLYEIGFILLLLGGYYSVKRSQHRLATFVIRNRGVAFRLFIVLYFSHRFLIEFLKDTNPILFNINSIQLVCVIFVLWYIRDIWRIFPPRIKPRKRR